MVMHFNNNYNIQYALVPFSQRIKILRLHCKKAVRELPGRPYQKYYNCRSIILFWRNPWQPFVHSCYTSISHYPVPT